jgi:protein gp37
MGYFEVSPSPLGSNRGAFLLWQLPSASPLRLPPHAKPLKWNAEAAAGKVGKDGKHWIVFAGDMCDLFDDEGIPDARERTWELIRRTPHLTWLLLTKRPQNFQQYLPADWHDGYPNVWLGVTVDDREHGYPRVDILRRTPAKVRYLSCEPLLEDISDIDLTGIDWVIVGGESGPNSREFDIEWARSLRRRCAMSDSAFFMKQIGQRPVQGDSPLPILHKSEAGKRDIHGKSPRNFPEDLRVMQWPDAGSCNSGDTDTCSCVPLDSFVQVMHWLNSISESTEPILASMAIAAYSSMAGLVYALDSIVSGGAE